MPERYATKEEVEKVSEELEPHLKITIAATLGTLADYTTTQIGLKYPEIREMNPHVDFGKEFFFAETGGVGVYTLAKLLKQRKDLSLVLGLIPASIPFIAAINNLAWITWTQRKYYLWEECPLLYPEVK